MKRARIGITAVAGLLLLAAGAYAQGKGPNEPLKIAMTANRWTPNGGVEFVQHKGIESLELKNGAWAVLNDLVFGSGTIEFDVETTGEMGTGIAFRVRGKDTLEYVYLRPSPKCSEDGKCM